MKNSEQDQLLELAGTEGFSYKVELHLYNVEHIDVGVKGRWRKNAGGGEGIKRDGVL